MQQNVCGIQGLFANVQILVDKFVGDKVWLRLNLRQQPRIGTINFHGVKKGEQKDLEDRLKLMKGNQITPNIVNRAKQIIKKYFDEKGFPNANVTVSTAEDISEPNYMTVDIVVNRHDKIKVHKIYISGNKALSDGKIKGAMKKPTKTATSSISSSRRSLWKATIRMTSTVSYRHTMNVVTVMPRY